MKKTVLMAVAALMSVAALAGDRINFNAGWLVKVGAEKTSSGTKCDDSQWEQVTLPHSYNQQEAFAKRIDDLTDTTAWYRKHFVLPEQMKKAKKFFIEFEGVRFGARVFLNGKELGWGDNGVMAFGFDMTPYIKKGGDNVLAVFIDNSWHYREHAPKLNPKNGKMTRSGFQWNDHNFFCNYGGINKNVWLHVMYDDVYQTLPLYSNLETTGVYVYATDHNVKGRTAKIHAESQVKNDGQTAKKIDYQVTITSVADGKQVAAFSGKTVTVEPGQTATCCAEAKVGDLHFWSWGYGYLYDVETSLVADGRTIDRTVTRTGFRKTAFKDGMVYLNDRVIQLKGFAQRSTNEWPAVGISIPAWMSDYSNRLVLGCNGNFYRWMHVTPMKQDIESFDRLGLIQAMPAGDSEKDVTDRRWGQRTEVMRDAIIYNRNNPSILFYECGNNQISEEHMAEMKAIRDQYDPNGGRAIGSRNMLDSKVAEYGGEMLYVNKSAGKPMFMMEYCRNEGIRRYWDQWSYPYHKEGEGRLYRGEIPVSYNHNQDGFAVENIIRWNEYWMARPGQGKRVNSGGAKIIFSDTNTHYRGEVNYRTSGDVDAMRIAKDSYFAHQVMWDGWVDTEQDHTYIVGHWNYEKDVVKPVYVVSTGDEVELLLNGKSLGKGERSETFLFTFKDVKWQAGKLEAVSRKDGREVSRYAIQTVGKPATIKMTWVEAPADFRADGADIRMADVEIVDKEGRRCPLAHDMITFDVKGEAQWVGGLSGVPADSVNGYRVLSKELGVEAGICRVILRSTTKAGNVTLTAQAKGFKAAKLTTNTVAAPTKDGFYVDNSGKVIAADWAKQLPLYTQRGETPQSPSFRQHLQTVAIKDITSPSDTTGIWTVCDDNEASKWQSDGLLQNSQVTFRLERAAAISQIALRVEGFRKTSYPLEITTADGTVIWSGYTDKSLGYAYCQIDKPVKSDTYTIRMIGPATVKEAFGDMTELAAKKNVSKKASKSNKLGLIEVEFKEKK
ncbi:MAG: DUF4982 domain-containing protein [Prevotella sp.]|nr:DUF4982 domain-containing protein [Prevotella sp.]